MNRNWIVLAGMAASLAATATFVLMADRFNVWVVPLFVAMIVLLSLLVRHVAHHLDARARYEREHERLAGPRPGAHLPR